MNRKSASIVKRSEAKLRRMAKRGEIKSDWQAAAKKPVPSGRDPDDAMEEIESVVGVLPRHRLRLLYSLGDFQLALSAAAFLSECDPEAKYSNVELRRFRCYETTIIIAYTRPFSQSKGGIPHLSLKMVGATLSAEQKKLHQKLMNLRNKVIAHSDADMMRMVSKAHLTKFDNGFKFVYLQTAFDEGLTFIGDELIALDELLHLMFSAMYTKLLKEAQMRPKDFDIRKDYLK
jgi:hypothetical protein